MSRRARPLHWFARASRSAFGLLPMSRRARPLHSERRAASSAVAHLVPVRPNTMFDPVVALLSIALLLCLSGVLFPLVGPPGSAAAAPFVRFWTLVPGLLLLAGAALLFFSVTSAFGAPYRSSDEFGDSVDVGIGILFPVYFLGALFSHGWSHRHALEWLLTSAIVSVYLWTVGIYVFRRLFCGTEKA